MWLLRGIPWPLLIPVGGLVYGVVLALSGGFAPARHGPAAACDPLDRLRASSGRVQGKITCRGRTKRDPSSRQKTGLLFAAVGPGSYLGLPPKHHHRVASASSAKAAPSTISARRTSGRPGRLAQRPHYPRFLNRRLLLLRHITTSGAAAMAVARTRQQGIRRLGRDSRIERLFGSQPWFPRPCSVPPSCLSVGARSRRRRLPPPARQWAEQEILLRRSRSCRISGRRSRRRRTKRPYRHVLDRSSTSSS